MSLNEIVNVVITRQTQTVTEQGFGIPMILGPSVQFTDRIKYYTDMDEVALDFPPSTPEYIAAQDIFSQVISPELIAIGRRQVDELTIAIETAMSGKIYTNIINGITYAIPSNSTATYSVVTLNADLVTGNRIGVSVNGTQVGTVTSVIKYSTDFTTGSSTVTTINGDAAGAGVPFTADNAGTLAAIATQIEGVTSVQSATSDGIDTITVVFANPGDNTVDSSITIGGSEPVATISQGGFVFDTSSTETLQNIANAIALLPGIASAIVSGPDSRTLSVMGPKGVTATVNSFVVTLGASQPGVNITNPLQPTTAETIVEDIVQAINDDPDATVTATDNLDGTYTISNDVAGEPLTVKVSTDIVNPNGARVVVTQVMPNTTYNITLNGVEFSYISPLNVQTTLQVAAGLVEIINLLNTTVAVEVEDNLDGSIQITSTNPSSTFSISVTPDILTIQKGMVIQTLVGSDPVEDDLTTINNINSDWYALISTERELQTVLDIAEWVETRIKLFGTASADPTIINVDAGVDNTSIAARLNQNGYIRSFVMYHQDAAFDYPEAAWFGRVLPLEPGSETWKFKTLNTISYSNLTTTQQNRAFAKKCNTYQFVGGVGMTANGTTAQGEYIDIVRGIDWLTATIQRFVFAILVNNPKVPYTDAGITAVQAEVMRALSLGVSNNFIASDPEYIVTVPKAADVPSVDKANRILRNVRFTATLSGAIHATFIKGVVSV